MVELDPASRVSNDNGIYGDRFPRKKFRDLTGWEKFAVLFAWAVTFTLAGMIVTSFAAQIINLVERFS